MKILFCGTPEFAVPTLERLIDSPFRPVCVVTQPDRRRGRGQKIAPSPVKEVALAAGLPLHQPEKFNDHPTWRLLEEHRPDLAVVVAYAAKIGRRALSSVPKGWINLHPSLLPKYRGAAPMQWALMNGETRTGLTTFFLNEAWDAGPICLQEELAIHPEETYGELSDRCARLGADLILRSLELIAAGTEPRIPQDDSQATFAPLLTREDSLIDWTMPATTLTNRIRGLTPHPGARTETQGAVLRILSADALPDSGRGLPVGTAAEVGPDGIIVQSGEGMLRINRLQPEGRPPMSVRDFLNGRRLEPGTRFGITDR